MTRMKTLAWGVTVLLAGVGPAAADNHADAPSSLRMRARNDHRWFTPHWRVAQAAPDPAPADPVADPAAAPAEPAPGEPAAPVAPASAAPAPTVDQTPALTDDELTKLAEQEAKTEVITVTGSTIERKTLTTPAPVT